MKERVKSILMYLKGKWWYIILFLTSSGYLFTQRSNLWDLTVLTVPNLIFYLWIILLVFPLFSELEVMGIKVKKEVEKATKEVKAEISDLRLQMMDVKIGNSMSLSVYSGDAPTREEVSEINKASVVREKDTKDNSLVVDEIVSEDAVYLFKVRLTLEKALSSLCGQLYAGTTNTNQMLAYIVTNGLLEKKTADYLRQIFTICNRGIHGEIISEEYMKFVKNILPSVLKKINETTSRLGYKNYFVCPRCKYSGYSEVGNQCPVCGFVSDDE